jgi:hypothetical protein
MPIIVEENRDIIQKDTKALLNAGKEVGLEVNLRRTKYILMPRYQYPLQMHRIQIAKRSFEEVANFKYLGTALTYADWIRLAEDSDR